MRCPGQDRRYWTPEDVTEVDCAKCGAVVEFFKTDGARECPGCGKRVVNPKVAAGCAQWCAAAVECLGFDPKSVRASQAGKSAADHLFEAIHGELPKECAERAREATDHALRFALERRADPRVTLAATMLAEYEPEASDDPEEPHPKTRALLAEQGFGDEAVEAVCAILQARRSGLQGEGLEAEIVEEAWRSTAPA